ncbi:MAG TPA: tRNA-guanine transglycosylase DpdA, partial [Chloroflexia bacterium]
MISRLGEKVRRLREDAGLSQREFAQALGLSANSRGYISEIELGKKAPPAVKIVHLARFFNVTPDYLLLDDQDSRERPHSQMSIRFYMPDWDDRVDPGYNFITDEHTPGRDPYRDDHYAHEIYPSAPYDGVLLSLATLDENPGKRAAILDVGTVHRYFRLPEDGNHMVLGDCGAFTYWRAEVPPYRTEQVLENYQVLGFDLGVSIDHLIVTEVEAEKEKRWQITVTNAEEFLRLHRCGGYSFTPVGVAQGWDPLSYQRAVAALVKIGYRYIAIGG